MPIVVWRVVQGYFPGLLLLNNSTTGIFFPVTQQFLNDCQKVIEIPNNLRREGNVE